MRSHVSSSLRANGSRECAPDDRLREAIHEATKKQEWIASLRSLCSLPPCGGELERGVATRATVAATAPPTPRRAGGGGGGGGVATRATVAAPPLPGPPPQGGRERRVRAV